MTILKYMAPLDIYRGIRFVGVCPSCGGPMGAVGERIGTEYRLVVFCVGSVDYIDPSDSTCGQQHRTGIEAEVIYEMANAKGWTKIPMSGLIPGNDYQHEESDYV